MLLLPNEFCESSSNKIWNKEKKNKKKRYIMREKPKLGKPLYGNLVTFNEKFFKKCKTTHSLCPNLREMWMPYLYILVSFDYFRYEDISCNVISWAFLSIPAINKSMHICKHKITFEHFALCSIRRNWRFCFLNG